MAASVPAPASVTSVPHPAQSTLIPNSLGEDEHGSSVRDLQRHLQRLEERLSSREINLASSVGHDPALDQALHDLTEKVQRIEGHLASHSVRGDIHEDSGLSIPEVPSRLHVSANKMKLLGPTHWIHKVDQV